MSIPRVTSHHFDEGDIDGQFVLVATLEQLRATGLLGVQVDDVELVLVYWLGAVRAYEGRCPHQGTLLSEGELREGHLICSAHQWQFDCLGGRKVDQPDLCLRSVPIVVKQDRILVERSAIDATRTSRHSKRGRTRTSLPGPRGWPWLGNLPQVKRTAFHQKLET